MKMAVFENSIAKWKGRLLSYHWQKVQMGRLIALLFLLSVTTLNQQAMAQPNVAKVYQEVSQAVVLILSYNNDEGARSKGTGSIIADELILTNAHVVQDISQKTFKKIYAFLRPENLNDSSLDYLEGGLRARVELLDEGLDLALLRVKDLSLVNPILLGNSNESSIGDDVLAIGHPENGGLWSLTSGRIGSVLKNFEKVPGKNVFQTEASLNRGNSGGPLLNLNGEMIGVNSSVARKASDGLAITGINFALQSNVVRQWLHNHGFELKVPQVAKLAVPSEKKSQNSGLKAFPKPSPARKSQENNPQKSDSSPETSNVLPAPSAKKKAENKILTPIRPFSMEVLFEKLLSRYEKQFDEQMNAKFKSVDESMENLFNTF